ncbi:MAG: ABC transporter substrate-binding protein [bacterium]|nr:ABC transporter substrate-binding protein [bacterium]
MGKIFRSAMPIGYFLICMLAPTVRPAYSGEVTEQLRVSVDQIIEILSNGDLKAPEKEAERRAAIRRIVDQVFDWEEMARRSLARHWKDRTSEEKERFTALFSQLLERTYISKIERYEDEKVLYGEEKIDNGYGVLKTSIASAKGASIPVEYRLRHKNSRWLVYDVVVEGVSLVNNYRTQFAKMLQSGNYEELVRRLEEKVKG